MGRPMRSSIRAGQHSIVLQLPASERGVNLLHVSFSLTGAAHSTLPPILGYPAGSSTPAFCPLQRIWREGPGLQGLHRLQI